MGWIIMFLSRSWRFPGLVGHGVFSSLFRGINCLALRLLFFALVEILISCFTYIYLLRVLAWGSLPRHTGWIESMLVHSSDRWNGIWALLYLYFVASNELRLDEYSNDDGRKGYGHLPSSFSWIFSVDINRTSCLILDLFCLHVPFLSLVDIYSPFFPFSTGCIY